MAWTYDLTQLATSPKDQVRLEISDVDIDNQLMQDEEIAQMLTEEADMYGAAARCCEILSRRFAGKADIRLGRSLNIIYSEMAKGYAEQARRLRAKSMGRNAPYVGGMSEAEKIANRQETDRTKSTFRKGQFSNPWQDDPRS
ncbi:MAG: hypothetical protein KGL39_17525 [Patescibacteria group bacterium]|nr:hypothetical protein [Patescibacteria group bacterium]